MQIILNAPILRKRSHVRCDLIQRTGTDLQDQNGSDIKNDGIARDPFIAAGMW